MQCFARPVCWGLAGAVVACAAWLNAADGLFAQEEPDPLRQRIDRLIELLGDESYAVRQRAEEELAEIGFEAVDALSAAACHDDPEIASRARYLLRLIRVEWTREDDPAEVKELLEDYEFLSPADRCERIRGLARLPLGRGIPALCRLVRFEQSAQSSKYAAVEILATEPADQTGRARWAARLKEHVKGSPRPAARWLLAYLRLRDDPRTGLAEWSETVEAERAILNRTPAESSPRIVAALLYILAEAQADQGSGELADRTAARARELNPCQDVEQLFALLETVYALRHRGLFEWAELEYRRLLEVGPPQFKPFAQAGLSEMWHDQGKNLAAAEILEEMLDLDPKTLQAALSVIHRSAGEVRARMDYFFACHWAEKGNHKKHREHLDKAVEADPSEIDVLIARYRLPETTPEYRQKTLELIAEAASAIRRRIQESPDEPNNYNQFAWLIGNTEGDMDEALKCAEKAVQLEPDNGAYYDTMAHVYFGRGEFEQAVKYQTKAAELEPHSGLITRQLELFRNKSKQGKR